MRKILFTCSIIFLLLTSQSITSLAQVKVLFDATKAETAGNADWVIDADLHNLNYSPAAIIGGGNESNAQRYPAPAQSGITSATPETYWQGGLSAWGIDCVRQGLAVETLPWNGSITYGSASNPQDLSNYKVYVVCEPNIQFTPAEKTAIIHFVQAGGGLFMISDHTQSDRNGDGWDSPAIWNDLMNTNAVQVHPFGFSYDLQDFSETSSNVIAAANDSLIHGTMGNVTQVQWSNGTSMTLNPAQNGSIRGIVYRTGTSAGNTGVMVAYGRYGSGKFVAIGDSSPCDDGTGDANDQLYNGYTLDAAGNHRRLLMNATLWLAAANGGAGTGISAMGEQSKAFIISPNPASGTVRIYNQKEVQQAEISISDMTGKCVYAKSVSGLSAGQELLIPLHHGIYIIRIDSGTSIQTEKIMVS